MEKAYLVLADGRVFEGRRIGAAGDGVGELVFTTGVVGYLETLTDPSYAGQIILQTFPQIGNYGVIPSDCAGKSFARGYVVRELCGAPSNFRSEYELDTFLKNEGVPGVCGVDTRELTRILREEGVMNAMICSAVPDDLSALRGYRVTLAVAETAQRSTSVHAAEGEARYHVTLIDCGTRGALVRNLQARGCTVTVVPHDTAAADILAAKPDGVVVSDGPGDPAENAFEIAQLAGLIGAVPVFGVGLGHQLAALALGGRTVKLPYGHRGANQPVRLCGGARTYITAQNHGYAVVSESLADVGRALFVNANDGSCEGMDYPGLRCFTVQFHPDAKDMAFLLDRFAAMMGGAHNA